MCVRKHSQNAQNDRKRMLGGELLFADKRLRQLKLPMSNALGLARQLKLAGAVASELAAYDRWHPALRVLMSRPSVSAIYGCARAAGFFLRMARGGVSAISDRASPRSGP